MNKEAENSALILFDGVCNFCDASINFAIRHDKRNELKFAPLQSEAGQALQAMYGISAKDTDSIILIENGKAYLRSTAALRITKHLNGLYPLMYGLIIIPAFIRDAVYNYIAKNRYKWFGRKDSCMVPTAEIRAKFIS